MPRGEKNCIADSPGPHVRKYSLVPSLQQCFKVFWHYPHSIPSVFCMHYGFFFWRKLSCFEVSKSLYFDINCYKNFHILLAIILTLNLFFCKVHANCSRKNLVLMGQTYHLLRQDINENIANHIIIPCVSKSMQKTARMLEYATVEYLTRYVEEYFFTAFSQTMKDVS